MREQLAPSEANQVLHVRQLTAAELEKQLEGRCALQREAAWDFWKTTQDLHFDGPNSDCCVAAGFPTDLVSVPSVFGWFIPRAGRYARAAVLHDHLWSVGVDHGEADRRFRAQLEHDGVSLLRRWIMWAAVRMRSIVEGEGGSGWPRDLPGAVLMLLIALPFITVPAIAILISNAAFFALEWLVAVPLRDEKPRMQFRT